MTRAKRSERETRTESNDRSLRALLVGGDRRSIARSNEALAILRAHPHRLAELVRLTEDSDWLVVMRAMDLLEKLAHEQPDWIQPYRALFIGPLAQHESWEIRLQIARALPLLKWTAKEREKVVSILTEYANDRQTFVKAWAVDSLAKFAEGDAALLASVEQLLEELERSESRALESRARLIRKRLNKSKGDATEENVQ
ncbi:MAG TPA: HEAT repeat domain-containing protein [Burkholderiales bacterium]|nr:HEAT repeat domain-containing protein [Burkholderiales bacterium]